MSPRQVILLILSALTTVVVALALVSSWQQPQIQSRLDLAQTNLSLQAAEWEPPPEWEMNGLPGGLIGDDVYETAIAQYRDALNSVRRTLDDNQQQRRLLSDSPVNGLPEVNQLDGAIQQAQDLKFTLELRLGILLAENDRPEEAISLWRNLLEELDSAEPDFTTLPQTRTAAILIDLWNQSPPDSDYAEALLNNTLSGWFRDRALSQLYDVQQDDEALAALQAREQETAQKNPHPTSHFDPNLWRHLTVRNPSTVVLIRSVVLQRRSGNPSQESRQHLGVRLGLGHHRSSYCCRLFSGVLHWTSLKCRNHPAPVL